MGAAVALLAVGSAQGARKAAPANTSSPTISGTARAGETLSASSGTWSGSTPIAFSYRWQRCNRRGDGCGSTGGTNQTYTLQKGDVGRRMRVSVTASNADGSANAVSSATGEVAKGLEPESTSPPAISGTAKSGSTLSTSTGGWRNNPTSFDYEWRRCDAAGNNCRNVGPNRNTYLLTGADVGATMRARVRARNQFGSNPATSAPTAVVAPGGPVPGNTAPPIIGGLARDGQLLVSSTGTWTNNPNHYDFQWLRCDSAGNNCGNFGGDSSTQRLSSSEVGHRIRVDCHGEEPVRDGKRDLGSDGDRHLPRGRRGDDPGRAGLPAESARDHRRPVRPAEGSRPAQAFIGRFRVSDARGNLVRGALVYAIGLPYGWVRPAPEVVTGNDGWATIQFFPTRLMPLHKAALVFFVRARKPGENLLAGVSTRRLVQVGIG